MELKERQEKFCQLYVETGNATQSYIDAGYETEGNSAAVNASRLLRNAHIQLRVSQIRSKHQNKFQVNQEIIIDRLCKIVFEGSTIAEINEDGEMVLIPHADVADVDGLSFSKSEMSQSSESGRGGSSEMSSSSINFSIKNRDKLKALDMLCKILGIYDNKRESTNTGNFSSNARRVSEALRRIRPNHGTSEDAGE